MFLEVNLRKVSVCFDFDRDTVQILIDFVYFFLGGNSWKDAARKSSQRFS